jgi:hypothetical protein
MVSWSLRRRSIRAKAKVVQRQLCFYNDCRLRGIIGAFSATSSTLGSEILGVLLEALPGSAAPCFKKPSIRSVVLCLSSDFCSRMFFFQLPCLGFPTAVIALIQ